VVGFKNGVFIKTVNARNVLANYLVKNTSYSENPADSPAENPKQNSGQPFHVYGKLEFIRFVHAYAALGTGGKPGQELCPKPELYILHFHRIVLAHGNDLFPQGGYIPRLVNWQDIAAGKLHIILSPLDKVGLDSVSLKTDSLYLPDAPDIVGNPVFLPSVFLQV